MVWEWILGGIIVVAILVIVYYINKIIRLSNRIDNAWSQIDVQLKKRADLVPNLVETVRGYMKHERRVFTEVTKARESSMKAKTPSAKMEAGNMLADALKTIFARAEAYPQLRATENFKLLQEQLEGIENKIAYSRQFYNDSTLVYNNIISTIPGKFFAVTMGRTQQKPYLETPKGERRLPRVRF